MNYGAGEGEDVVEELSLVLLGEEPPPLEVSVLVLELELLLLPPAGDEVLTMVVFLSGAGLALASTLVFCSQAASNAALAKMQSVFFIGL